MTREDIIKWGGEADLLVTTPIPEDSVFVADLERFAALVAAAEREACAKVCDEKWIYTASPSEMAEYIRARGNT